jgi:hypothetical protein
VEQLVTRASKANGEERGQMDQSDGEDGVE